MYDVISYRMGVYQVNPMIRHGINCFLNKYIITNLIEKKAKENIKKDITKQRNVDKK